jgi:O-antigen ligase
MSNSDSKPPRVSPIVRTAKDSLAGPFWFAAGFSLVLLAADLGVMLGPLVVLYFAVLGIAGCCVFLAVFRPRLLLGFVIFITGLSGGMSQLGGLKIGSVPISLAGLVTGLIAVGAVLSLCFHWGLIRKLWLRDFFPFWIFAGFAVLRCFGSHAGADAWRQAFLISAPLLIPLLTNLVVTLEADSIRWTESVFFITGFVAIGGLLATVLAGLIQSTPEGFISIFGRRSLALVMMLMLITGLAHWRYGESMQRKRIGLYLSVAALAVILGSLSRTTSVVALLFLVPLRFVKVIGRSFFALLIGPILGVALLAFLLLWAPVRARFLGEDASLADISDFQSGGVDVNTSGRDALWGVTFLDALERPLFGHGTGTASKLVQDLIGDDHPHNDYLRVFHDQGLVGLALFLWAWGSRILRHWRAWRSSRGAPLLLLRYRMIGFLVAVSIPLSFLTDNLMVYWYMLMPSYLLFAMSDFVEREATSRRVSSGSLISGAS